MKLFTIGITQLMSFWIIVAIVNQSESKVNKTIKVPLIKHKKPSKHLCKRDVSSLHLNAVEDDFNYGWVKIGTPGQPLRVIFDTGSSESWVMSSLLCEDDPRICRSCGHYIYDFRKSSTFQKVGKRWSIEYQDNSYFSGIWCRDNIHIANFLLEDQLFAEATYGEQAEICTSYDGIFGLGYQRYYTEECVFRNMMLQHLLDNPVFCFYLNSESNSSEVIFGGIDHRHYTGDIVYTECISDNDWIINCERVYINNRLVMRDCDVLVDSGTSLLLGPPEFIDPFTYMVGGDLDELDCSDMDSMPSVTFVFKGLHCTLTPRQYMIEEPEDEEYYAECMCGIDSSDLPMFIFGTVFMKNFFTVFDMDRGLVGFAKSRA